MAIQYQVISNKDNQITFTGTFRQAWDHLLQLGGNQAVANISSKFQIRRA